MQQCCVPVQPSRTRSTRQFCNQHPTRKAITDRTAQDEANGILITIHRQQRRQRLPTRNTSTRRLQARAKTAGAVFSRSTRRGGGGRRPHSTRVARAARPGTLAVVLTGASVPPRVTLVGARRHGQARGVTVVAGGAEAACRGPCSCATDTARIRHGQPRREKPVKTLVRAMRL